MLLYIPIFFVPSTPLQFKTTYWLINCIVFILSTILLAMSAVLVRQSNKGTFTHAIYTSEMDRSAKELVAAAAFTLLGNLLYFVITPILPAATWLPISLVVYSVVAAAMLVGGASAFEINGRHITKHCLGKPYCKIMAGTPIVAYILLFFAALLFFYGIARIFTKSGLTSSPEEQEQARKAKAAKADA